jgi:hypothetical protein
MAETNFRVFNEAMDPANTFNDSEYEHATQRLQGVAPGIALSRQHNKMYRQSSAMATAIANFIVSTGEVDCKDDDIEGITAGLALAINNIMDDGGYITLTDVMKRILVQSASPDGFLEKGLFIQTSANDSTSLKGALKTKVGDIWYTIKIDIANVIGLSSALDGYMVKTGGTFTGAVSAQQGLTVKTMAAGDSSLNAASTNFVQDLLSSIVSGYSWAADGSNFIRLSGPFNGLTLQFGLTGDIPKNGTYQVNYPIAFTHLLYAGGFAIINGGANNLDQIKMYNFPNQYNMTLLNTADNYTARTYWLAIGLIW